MCTHDYIHNMRVYFKIHFSILFVIADHGIFLGQSDLIYVQLTV